VGRFNLNCSVALGGYLHDEGRLDYLQRLLVEMAPEWSAGLHIRRRRQERELLDLSVPGVLAKAVRERAMERGDLFQQLTKQLADSAPRVFGQAEFAGSDPSLVVVVSVDENILSRAGDKMVWGNRIALQVGRSTVNRVPAVTWGRRAFEALCQNLSPQYGHAEIFAEYEAKNISHEDGGTRAIGLDVGKHLPGLYWLNFFGEPFCTLIGAERILAAPALETRRIDRGVLVALANDPIAWNTSEYKLVEARVRDHLGHQYFFSRDQVDRRTIAPNFGAS